MIIHKRQFLKALVLTSVGLPLSNTNANQLVAKQKDPIVLQCSTIRGFAYYRGKRVLSQIQVNDSLMLKRERNNQYDDKAIAVYWQNLKLGYIPRDENAALAQMLDRGQQVITRVSNLIPDNDWEPMDVEVQLII